MLQLSSPLDENNMNVMHRKFTQNVPATRTFQRIQYRNTYLGRFQEQPCKIPITASLRLSLNANNTLLTNVSRCAHVATVIHV